MERTVSRGSLATVNSDASTDLVDPGRAKRYHPGMSKLGPTDGAAFIAKMEQAIEDGSADYVAANMPKLETLIAKLQDRTSELAGLQYRARLIRDRHEPSAEQRGMA